jgi:hypothetical protein
MCKNVPQRVAPSTRRGNIVYRIDNHYRKGITRRNRSIGPAGDRAPASRQVELSGLDQVAFHHPATVTESHFHKKNRSRICCITPFKFCGVLKIGRARSAFN